MIDCFVFLMFFISLFLFEKMLGFRIEKTLLLKMLAASLITAIIFSLIEHLTAASLFTDKIIPCCLVVIGLWDCKARGIKVVHVIYSALFSYLICFVTAILSINLFRALSLGGGIFTKLFAIVFSMGIVYILTKFRFFSIIYPASVPSLLLYIITGSFLISFLFMDNGDLNARVLLFAIPSLMLLSLAYKLGAYFQKRREKKQMMHNLFLYTQELESLNEELSVFKHDYINVLLSLENSIKKKNMPQIEQIFYDTVYPSGDLIRVQKNNIQKYSNIQIPELKNLLISEEMQAKDRGSYFDVDIIGQIDETATDKNSLLQVISILLEQAIKMVNPSKPSQGIQLALMKVGNDFSFSCKTPASNQTISGNKLFKNTQSETGLDRYSLNKVLEKNPSISLTTEMKENSIIQTILVKGTNEFERGNL